MTATVTDAEGRLVDGLTAADFEIYEDRERRPVTYFSRERVPLSLGLVLDTSDSMYGQRIEDARFALNRFLLDLLEPSDEAFLLVFNHRPMVATGWTRTPSRLSPELEAVRPWGATAMYDAMLEALPLFESRRHQRAAIVLISDGADTASDHPVREVRDRLRRSEAFVYAIAIDAKESAPINDQVNPSALREMTDESGGYTEVVRETSELVPAGSPDRRRVKPPVHAGLHAVEAAGRALPAHPRAGGGTGLHRPGATRLRGERHSSLSATIGSTLVARRAGRGRR